MRRPARIAIGIAALGALQLGAWWVYHRVEARRTSAVARFELEPASGEAPALAAVLSRSDGTTLQLQELSGRPIVLHFWATWCVPCRDELPTLLQLEAALTGDATFVLVSVDAGWEPIREFFAGNVPPSVALDGDEALRTAYDVGPLPRTWLIDSEGQLRARVEGARDWRSPRALTAILELSASGVATSRARDPL